MKNRFNACMKMKRETYPTGISVTLLFLRIIRWTYKIGEYATWSIEQNLAYRAQPVYNYCSHCTFLWLSPKNVFNHFQNSKRRRAAVWVQAWVSGSKFCAELRYRVGSVASGRTSLAKGRSHVIRQNGVLEVVLRNSSCVCVMLLCHGSLLVLQASHLNRTAVVVDDAVLSYCGITR